MKINKTNLPHGALTGYNNPNKIIIHHPEFYGSIENLNSIMRNMGYSMIGYNYYIRKDGSVWEGRPLNCASANCYGQNNSSIGVCFEGNYERDTSMPQAQFKAGVELIQYLKSTYGINEVGGHKKYYNTACPGKNFPLQDMLKAINGQNYNSNVTYNKLTPNNNIYGKKHNLISQLQQEINKQGFGNVAVDGIAGDATLNASPVCRQGARGGITKIIQQMLINIGYPVGQYGADGVFGNGTVTAIKALQKDCNLNPDGIVGRETWKALFRNLK
ncbi:TPA: N-acetylmuramoyl-L-alanine amidase [Clostridium botulinum]|nr:N-acetylmuramoyl-L-alanine amidase [Clostridium botulinum]